MSAPVRRVPVRVLALLFLAFVVLSLLASVMDIRADEARLLWIVRDPERLEPAAIGDTVRIIGRNLRIMLDRADTRDLPLAAPLDVWTMLAGGSIFAARLPLVLLTCLILAVILRLTARRSPRLAHGIGYAVPIAGLVAYGLLPANLAPTIADYRNTRQPTEPVVTLFRDDSALGYYQAQYDLRRGVGIDLGWRSFSDDEIRHTVTNLGTGTVWLLADADGGAAFEAVNAAVLDNSNRRLTHCPAQAAVIAVLRYESGSVTPDAACSSP